MEAVALFVAGLALLVVSAELVVRGSARLATSLGITPMVIGLTIVSVGTSTPELAVGIIAAQQGNGALAVGNIAGTNVLNLLFILGLSAWWKPLPLHLGIFKLELPMIVFAALLMTVLGWDGTLSRFDGSVLLAAGIVYTAALVRITHRASKLAKKEFREEYGPETVSPTEHTWLMRVGYMALLAAGIVLTVVGAEWLVRGAVNMAGLLGISDTIIGLTIVAIGTSSPELVTTVISTIRDDRDVAIGNLLGSSIYNILLILSVTCIVAPGGLPVEPQLMTVDIPLMAGVALGAIPIFLTGKQVSRLEGALGVAIYIAYITWLLLFHA